jgi:hypothetical protein
VAFAGVVGPNAAIEFGQNTWSSLEMRNLQYVQQAGQC